MSMTGDGMVSRAMEDYLKAIYLASGDGESVSTSRLAESIGCSAASVTNMVQKLSQLKLVSYRPYQGVTLTEAGTRIALEVVRHHRLIELYLAEVLGYSWDKVHDEADKLEHVISEEFEDRIDKALGHPTHDPHGHPIPSKEGEIAPSSAHTLWETAPGQDVRIERVSDRDPEVLRYLASIGVYPNVVVTVVSKAPFNGPTFVRLDREEHTLSEQLCRQIYVTSV